jgi:hypothetical protein
MMPTIESYHDDMIPAGPGRRGEPGRLLLGEQGCADRVRCRHVRDTDERQYHLVMALTFALFLVSTALLRLFPGPRQRARRRGRSIVAEARATARIAVPFAFRG